METEDLFRSVANSQGRVTCLPRTVC
eukprot:COSAG03_NODE_28758_length_194_cov_38.221053_1_plen_25_part_01